MEDRTAEEKVVWCVNHASLQSAEDEICEWLALYSTAYHTVPSPCSFVDRLLIPIPE